MAGEIKQITLHPRRKVKYILERNNICLKRIYFTGRSGGVSCLVYTQSSAQNIITSFVLHRSTCVAQNTAEWPHLLPNVLSPRQHPWLQGFPIYCCSLAFTWYRILTSTVSSQTGERRITSMLDLGKGIRLASEPLFITFKNSDCGSGSFSCIRVQWLIQVYTYTNGLSLLFVEAYISWRVS